MSDNIKLAGRLPFNVFIKRVIKNLFPKKYTYHLIDERLNTADLAINNLLIIKDLPNLIIEESIIKNYLKHQFNYLGTGWVSLNSKNNSGITTLHKTKTNIILSQIDLNYQFISWQKDVVAAYNFDVNKPFNQQRSSVGVDIKHPWELGRLQHLPRLAFYAINNENRIELLKEFKNQTLDFIGNNPIGMGVQWACTMDVGIRVSNLLLAYDVFSQIDETNILDDSFKAKFFDAIYLHGKFIFNHLEYKDGLTGNHYLFNLSGLLFVASYLNKNTEILKWLNFCQPEIEKELDKQFFNDGGNFEGSTTYHCLSAEMMIYSTALMLRNKYSFSDKFIQKLYQSGHFIATIMKPNGEMPQFGDNDSGRYFKLTYIKEENNENLLNYEGLLASFSTIFNDNQFINYQNKFPLESEIIKHLSANSDIKFNPIEKNIIACKSTKIKLKYTKQYDIKYALEQPITTNLKFEHFIDFGLTVIKAKNFYLAISTIANKNMHHSWGHVHNDKLAFELFVNDTDLVCDSGSYCYTSNIDLRNSYRSTKAHHTVVVNGVEQNKFSTTKTGLFYLDKEVKCQIIEVTSNSIQLMVKYYGIIHLRNFEICNDKLIIADYCNQDFTQNVNTNFNSRGYGREL